MAEEILCPVCETPNEAWNELCEACGAELHAHTEAEAEVLEADSEPTDFEDFEDGGEFGDEPSDFGVEPANDDFEFADDTGVDHDAPEADQPADEWEPAEDEAPVEIYEDSVVEDDEEVAYELEAIVDDEDEADEFFPDEDSGDDDFGGEEGFDEEQSFGEDSEVDFDDEFAADGGAPMDPAVAAQMQPEDEVSFDDEFAADSEPGFDDQISEVLAAESEPEEEEPPAPPELEAILNPERVERDPIAPLPEPGPFAEPAVLAVFKLGEQLGEIAIDADCTVLGLDEGAPDLASDDEAPEELDLADMEAIEPVEDEADEVAYELELVEEEDDSSDEVAFSDDFGHDQEFQAEDAADEFDFDGQDAASDAFDEDTPVAEMSEASDVSEVSVASEAYEEPADVEEGPVVDLAQFGDASAFASRHGYVFRQNKNYTLYVTSDAGTQLNDEVLTLGEHRKLADGDVIVLGGEVALRFDEPAA